MLLVLEDIWGWRKWRIELASSRILLRAPGVCHLLWCVHSCKYGVSSQLLERITSPFGTGWQYQCLINEYRQMSPLPFLPDTTRILSQCASEDGHRSQRQTRAGERWAECSDGAGAGGWESEICDEPFTRFHFCTQLIFRKDLGQISTFTLNIVHRYLN